MFHDFLSSSRRGNGHFSQSISPFFLLSSHFCNLAIHFQLAFSTSRAKTFSKYLYRDVRCTFSRFTRVFRINRGKDREGETRLEWQRFRVYPRAHVLTAAHKSINKTSLQPRIPNEIASASVIVAVFNVKKLQASLRRGVYTRQPVPNRMVN